MNRLDRNRAIERDELAAVVNRQREQVSVGEPAMAQQMGKLRMAWSARLTASGQKRCCALAQRVLGCASTFDTNRAPG